MRLFLLLLVRRMLIRKNLEFSPRPLVRTSVSPLVRSFVTAFLEILPLLFSETLQLVRTQKGGKNVPSAFLIIFTVLAILAKNCPILAFLAQNAQKRRCVRPFGNIFEPVHPIYLKLRS